MRTIMFAKSFCVLVVLCLITGCGITGNTQSFTLKVVPPSFNKLLPSITVASVDTEPNCSSLVVVPGVIPWGKFNSEDLSVLKKSLHNTFRMVNTSYPTDSQIELNIHMVVRRYRVAASNNVVAVLACVGWCITDQQNRIVYHEQFYASRKGGIFDPTLGAVKDVTNKAIVRSIVQNTVNYASTDKGTAFDTVVVKNTYSSFEAAIQNLPKSMTARFPYTWARLENVGWDQVKCSQDINWKDYLASR